MAQAINVKSLHIFRPLRHIVPFFQGLDETARSLAEAAVHEHARGRGLSGAVGGILRQVKKTVFLNVLLPF